MTKHLLGGYLVLGRGLSQAIADRTRQSHKDKTHTWGRLDPPALSAYESWRLWMPGTLAGSLLGPCHVQGPLLMWRGTLSSSGHSNVTGYTTNHHPSPAQPRPTAPWLPTSSFSKSCCSEEEDDDNLCNLYLLETQNKKSDQQMWKNEVGKISPVFFCLIWELRINFIKSQRLGQKNKWLHEKQSISNLKSNILDTW